MKRNYIFVLLLLTYLNSEAQQRSDSLQFLPASQSFSTSFESERGHLFLEASYLFEQSGFWTSTGRVLNVFIPGDPRTRFQLSPATDFRSYRTRSFSQYQSIYNRLHFIQEPRKTHVIYFH